LGDNNYQLNKTFNFIVNFDLNIKMLKTLNNCITRYMKGQKKHNWGTLIKELKAK